jgi:putative Mn2+ efflux pump MntP
MKIVMIIQTVLNLSKRFGVGLSDIKYLFNALKKNKEANDTPAGEYDYARLLGLATSILSIIFGILYAFGKLDAEVYNKLIEVLNE